MADETSAGPYADKSCVETDPVFGLIFRLEIQGKSGNIGNEAAVCRQPPFLYCPENHLQSQVILWLYIFFRL